METFITNQNLDRISIFFAKIFHINGNMGQNFLLKNPNFLETFKSCSKIIMKFLTSKIYTVNSRSYSQALPNESFNKYIWNI